jgi:hypothetical protein
LQNPPNIIVIIAYCLSGQSLAQTALDANVPVAYALEENSYRRFRQNQSSYTL